MSISLRGKMPGGDRNGLSAWEERIRDSPDDDLLIVMRIKAKEITDVIGNDDDPWKVTLGVSHVEVVHGESRSFVEACLLGAYEERTGKQPLQFGAEQ